MSMLKLNEEVNLIERLSEELNSYKEQLMQLKIQLHIRLEIIEKFKSRRSNVYKYIKCGEIFDDITKNYTDFTDSSELIENFNGDITDFIRTYKPKAEQQILDTEIFLSEIQYDEDIEEAYVDEIRKQLTYYKTRDIFIEFNTIQELLIDIRKEEERIYDGEGSFLEKLIEFNSLGEIVKYNCLNDFCHENIEGNTFVYELINLYNDYRGAEVIANITEVEQMTLFSRWNAETLKPVMNYSSKDYFKIIFTLNQIQQLNEDLLNREYVTEQIEFINELQQFLEK